MVERLRSTKGPYDLAHFFMAHSFGAIIQLVPEQLIDLLFFWKVLKQCFSPTSIQFYDVTYRSFYLSNYLAIIYLKAFNFFTRIYQTEFQANIITILFWFLSKKTTRALKVIIIIKQHFKSRFSSHVNYVCRTINYALRRRVICEDSKLRTHRRLPIVSPERSSITYAAYYVVAVVLRIYI